MKLRQVFTLLAVLALCASHATAQDTTRARQDDGWPDMSSFLDKPFGFLPILIPITKPALGYGAAGGLVFIDKRRDGKVDMRHPTMTDGFGFATEDGSCRERMDQALSDSWVVNLES
jgi:hypothetical protein